jgi:hypothetical protein
VCASHDSHVALLIFQQFYQMKGVCEQLIVKEMFYGLERSYKAEGNDKVEEVIHKIKN